MQVQLRWQWQTSSSPPLPILALSSSTILYGYRGESAAGRNAASLSAALRFNLTSQRCRLSTFTSSSDIRSNAISDDEVNSEGNDDDDGVEIEIEKMGKNRRRIRSKVAVNASLQNVWEVLTDYERLADFIPALAACQLLDKKPNFARLLQIGEQDLAFGLKFNAKGIVDCYEKDLEDLPIGQRRDIEFEMVEGDFKIFAGKWSIEQCNTGSDKEDDSTMGQAFHTTLFYIVEVEPKLWLPVWLVEGRLCKEIKNNLLSVQKEAQKAYLTSFSS